MEAEKLKSETMVIEEWSGTSSNKLSLTAVISVSSSFSVKTHGNRFNLFTRRFLEAFVPEGFPSSVTPDYTPFQTWDLLQGLSTYIRMMLSTQALLSAIGVGEKSATVIGATFQWFLRDLTGMLGGVMFTFYQGSNLDSNAKMWRLVADLMNDLGMLMDLLSPLFPSAFVFIVCLGSLSRSFTGVASGATRAALTQHFALQNNAADISAKEGSQETVATMIGMALGMLLAHVTMGHSTMIWLCFLSLTMFHMYANYKAVRCLNLTTLNCERSSILLLHFMETSQVLSPREVSIMEHVLPLWISSWNSKNIKSLYTRVRLGVRVSSLNSLEICKRSFLSSDFNSTA
uniref:protein root UVB sensitive 3 isoform X2 n=1 Tax=Erigeron canadensis TaxID=72917 RepID=UPI001CB8BC58|nr:protein root UVB sensitive 3 isoform X2 [Erigeron canadensis]